MKKSFVALGLLAYSLNIAWSGEFPAHTLSLSIQQYAQLALRNSLRSQSSEDNFKSNQYAWKAARHSLTFPVLSGSAEKVKSYSDDDRGTETEALENQGTLSLQQPFLTGADLSVEGIWTDRTTDLLVQDPYARTSSTLRTVPDLAVTFRQPLFVFTGNTRWRTRRQANLTWENSKDIYWKERLDIEFQAKTIYYDLLLKSQQSQVERKKFDSASIVNDTTKALVKAGKLAEVELVRADIQSKKDWRRIRNSESDLEQGMNLARDFISVEPNTALSLTSALSYKPFEISEKNTLLAAEKNNPDVRIAQRAIEIAEITLKDTREVTRPNVFTGGTYGLTRDRSANPAEPHRWDVSVGVNWIVFDAFQTRYKTEQARIAVNEARRSYENTLRQMRVDVQNVYLEIKRTEEQISEFQPQRDSAEQNVRAIRLQYKYGLTRLTDVFDAENQARDLELEYLQLLVTYNTARDRLKVLVGNEI